MFPGIAKMEGDTYDVTRVVMASLFLIAHICLALFLLFLIYRSKRSTVHLLAANAVAAGLLFSLLVRPGNIRLVLQNLPVTNGYCWLHVFLHQMEHFVVPWMLFMFTVNRLMYIRNPTVYGQKDSKIGFIAMMVIPWAFPFVVVVIDVALVSQRGQAFVQYTISNTTYFYCDLERFSFGRHMFIGIYMVIFCNMIPSLISLIVAITSLGMWCCFKKRQTGDSVYAMLGSDVTEAVRDSVISVSVLNSLYLVCVIINFVLNVKIMGLASFHLLHFIFVIIECVVWMTTLPGMRDDVKSLCCRRKNTNASNVHYNNVAHDNVDIDRMSAQPEV